MLLRHRFSIFSTVLLLTGSLFTSLVHAQCTINSGYGDGVYYLVNGRWKEGNPEVVFKVPGADLGNGSAVSPDSVTNFGNNKTLANHIRFRLAVSNQSSTGVRMYMNSSAPLSCVSCASNVTIPFSKISWTEGKAEETRGTNPGNGQFNNGLQNLIYATKKTDNVFNLQFNFANDEVLPAGTYEGEFLTRGIPQ